MNITFILGNGFDRQLGLNTGYNQFLKTYREDTDGDSENIKDFKEYLKKDEASQLWSDAEVGMGRHLEKFGDEKVESYYERIIDFIDKLFVYLQEQQKAVSYEQRTKISEAFSDFVFSSYKDALNHRSSDLALSNASSHNFSFISFNYTDVIDKLLSCIATGTVLRTHTSGNTRVEDHFTVYHVHGSLDSQIIMGVNDESQLNLNGGATLTDRLKWMLIKPTQNMESGNNWDKPAKSVIDKSDIIYIYGVSYGITDALWWERIQHWLMEKPEHKLVAFVRGKSNDGFNPHIPGCVRTYENNKRIEILEKLGIHKDIPKFNTLLAQVYIIRDTTRLDIKNILLPRKTVATCS